MFTHLWGKSILYYSNTLDSDNTNTMVKGLVTFLWRMSLFFVVIASSCLLGNFRNNGQPIKLKL